MFVEGIAMGLAERRAVKEFQDKAYPGLKKQVDKAAGFSVPIEVKWDSLASEGQSHLYADSYPKVFFEPLVKAFTRIAVDDMGKKALKEGLKEVRIANTKGSYSCSGFTFKDDILDIDHEPCSNVDDIEQRAEGIQKLLENGL